MFEHILRVLIALTILVFGVVWAIWPEKYIHAYVFMIGAFEALLLAIIQARKFYSVDKNEKGLNLEIRAQIYSLLQEDKKKLESIIPLMEDPDLNKQIDFAIKFDNYCSLISSRREEISISLKQEIINADEIKAIQHWAISKSKLNSNLHTNNRNEFIKKHKLEFLASIQSLMRFYE